MTQFYNTYPVLKPAENLKWSHYRLLSTIRDHKKRELLEPRASEGHWSKRTLEDFLRDESRQSLRPKKPGALKKKKLSYNKGRLYTYKMFKAGYAVNLLMDLGFNTFRDSGLLQSEGDIVETLKTPEGYKFKKAHVKRKRLYTYKAFIEKVIDGDTLWLVIDCGFGIWSRQKARLRGINAPAIETPAGRKAFRFVKDILRGTDFVIIKSHGRDKYDRYLVDLVHMRGADDPQVVLDKGGFLNQELLDRGLSERVD